MNIIDDKAICRFNFQVIISSDTHERCLWISKKIKNYISAWYFSVELYAEDKSARKNDVLQRGLRAKMEDKYGSILAFHEGLNCICSNYNLLIEHSKVDIYDGGTVLIEQ